MSGFKYIVTVCDHSPLDGTPYNAISYDYSSYRAAIKMMQQALSMNYAAVIKRVPWTNDYDV